MMAARHGRHEHDDERDTSLPATEKREREEEAAADAESAASGTPSLPETERRAREQERRED